MNGNYILASLPTLRAWPAGFYRSSRRAVFSSPRRARDIPAPTFFSPEIPPTAAPRRVMAYETQRSVSRANTKLLQSQLARRRRSSYTIYHYASPSSFFFLNAVCTPRCEDRLGARAAFKSPLRTFDYHAESPISRRYKRRPSNLPLALLRCFARRFRQPSGIYI